MHTKASIIAIGGTLMVAASFTWSRAALQAPSINGMAFSGAANITADTVS